MSNRYFKPTRILHKWMGIACFLFVIVLSVSGILLMHTDSLELSKRMIEGKFLPEKYFHVAEAHRSIQSILSISDDKTSLLFVGTDHGLFRSIDLGKSWIELKQGLFSQDIRTLAVDPKDSQRVYTGTPKGIFKSEDQGESWNEWFDQSTGLTNVWINDLVINPEETDIIYAATKEGLFVSDEGGDFWEPIKNGILKDENVKTIQFSAAYPSQLIINTETGFFRSSNDGELWERKWSDLPKDISGIITIDTDPEFIFVGSNKGFFKSFNGGLSWIRDKNKNLKNIFALAIDTDDNTSIFLASQKGLFYSKNSGDLWQEITPHKNNLKNQNDLAITPINKVLFVPASNGKNSLLLAGSETGLFVSKNNGALWSFVNLGDSGSTISNENFKMDLGKLVTEIHTGRFFGSYFYWLVDLASLGMIGLAVTGLMVIFYRKRIKKTKFSKKVILDEEIEIDKIIDISESTEDILTDNQNVADMVERISIHLEKCKNIYNTSQKNEEKTTIGQHISVLHKKIHHLMDNIENFSKLPQNIDTSGDVFLDPVEQKIKNLGKNKIT